MRTVSEARMAGATLIVALDRALGHLLRPLANLLPRRLRRAAEKLERQRTRPVGQIAALGFLARHHPLRARRRRPDRPARRLAPRRRRLRHRGRRRSPASRKPPRSPSWSSSSSPARSYLFDVADAQKRLAELPWVEQRDGAEVLSEHARGRDRGAEALRALAARRRGSRHRPERRTDRAARRSRASPRCPSWSAGAPTRRRSLSSPSLLTQPDDRRADARRGARRRPPLGPASRQRRHGQAAGEGRARRRWRSS